MTKRFCNRCGVEISDADAWHVTVRPAHGCGQAYRDKHLIATDLCWRCVGPAAQVAREGA